MKKVGIIVPVYNTAKYLPECLNSIINQSYKDIEILIVDDGSTDERTVELVAKYDQEFANITSIRIENSGQAVARNVGIDFFSKRDDIEFLQFVDSDDYLEVSCVEEAVANIGACDLLWFDYKLFFDGIVASNVNDSDIEEYGFTDSGIITAKFLLKKSIEIDKTSFSRVWDCLIRKSYLDEISLKFLDVFAEDDHFGIMLFACAKNIAVLPKKLYDYRIRKGSTIGYNSGNFSLKAIPKRLKPYLLDFFDNPMLLMKYYRAGGAAIMFNEIYNSLKDSENFELLKKTNFLKRHCMLALNLTSFINDPLGYKKFLSPELLDFAKEYKIGAYALIHSTLAYQLGQALISAKFGFKRLIKTPLFIYKIFRSNNFSRISAPNIDDFYDKKWADKLKNHKCYKIGRILVG